MMHRMFIPQPAPPNQPSFELAEVSGLHPEGFSGEALSQVTSFFEAISYLSDESAFSTDTEDDIRSEEFELEGGSTPQEPSKKRQRTNSQTTYRQACQLQKSGRKELYALSWKKITALMKSAKTRFIGGPNGLQARCTRAIESHLHLMLKNKYSWMAASVLAAEVNGFGKCYGACALWTWSKMW